MSRTPVLSFRPRVEALEDRCVLSGGLGARPHLRAVAAAVRGPAHHGHAAHRVHHHHHQAVTMMPAATPSPAPMTTPMTTVMGMMPMSSGTGMMPMY